MRRHQAGRFHACALGAAHIKQSDNAFIGNTERLFYGAGVFVFVVRNPGMLAGP
jgi:hypothetical protein